MQQRQLGMEGLGSSSGESPELVMSGELQVSQRCALQ